MHPETGIDRRVFLGRVAAGAAICAGLGGCRSLNPYARPVSVGDVRDGRAALVAVADLKVGGQLKVTAPWLEAPLLVARVAEDEFRAVSISCTHQGSELALDAGKRRFTCTGHGAQFAYDGTVLRGPASNPVRAYEVVREEDQLYLLASN